MASVFDIAASGLQAASLRLEASAQNVANVNTPGYRPVGVRQQAVPGGGVQASLGPSADVQGEARLDRTLAGLSGTDLVREHVELTVAAVAFRASLAALRSADEQAAAVLEIKA